MERAANLGASGAADHPCRSHVADDKKTSKLTSSIEGATVSLTVFKTQPYWALKSVYLKSVATEPTSLMARRHRRQLTWNRKWTFAWKWASHLLIGQIVARLLSRRLRLGDDLFLKYL
jgi:hypothetical protein